MFQDCRGLRISTYEETTTLCADLRVIPSLQRKERGAALEGKEGGETRGQAGFWGALHEVPDDDEVVCGGDNGRLVGIELGLRKVKFLQVVVSDVFKT